MRSSPCVKLRIAADCGTPVAPTRNRAESSGRGLDRNDLERVHLPLFIADRDVFAGDESMRAEAVAGFVVLLGNVLVIEHPAGVAGTPRAMHQTPHLVRLAPPEATHAAMVAVLAPQLRIDMPVGIERGHKLVAMAGGARGKFLRAGQVEPDALEHMRQRRHVPTSRLAGSRFRDARGYRQLAAVGARYLDFAQGAPHRGPILLGPRARGQGRPERACRRNATARLRFWHSWRTPPATADVRSGASIPMPPRCSWSGSGRSRSNGRSAFRFSIIRAWTNARRLARPSSQSTGRSRRNSTAALCRSRARRTDG